MVSLKVHDRFGWNYFGGCKNDPAPSLDVVSRRFEQFGFPLTVDETVIPDDDTTLFVCSGMQRVRRRFLTPDGTKHGSLQSCIRTNDLELVGDGSHLTYFQMLGSFSFGGDYAQAVDLWHAVLLDLRVTVEPVHVHPTQDQHRSLWRRLGYETVDDPDCVWSDGEIGGWCCEVYSRGLEIGNLVHTLGHSADVGFGWERLAMICEGQERVDQTSLFSHTHPVVADHARTLTVLWKNHIAPGAKGRAYVCRRLLRRILPLIGPNDQFVFSSWIEQERQVREQKLAHARRLWRRHKSQPASWWWETCGILPEEVGLLVAASR
jgi:alanyl-tRNA synthetase